MAGCPCSIRQQRIEPPNLHSDPRRLAVRTPRVPFKASRHPTRVLPGVCRCSSDSKRPSSSSATTSTVPPVRPRSAREAVELGQQSFDRADYTEALRLFKAALDLRPDNDEARAALYNKACAHARLKNWQEAADDVVSAVNDYGLKLEVAVKVWQMGTLLLVYLLDACTASCYQKAVRCVACPSAIP